MIMGIQILGVLFAMFLLYLSYMNYKRKDFTMLESVGWSFVWVLLLIIAVWPQVTMPFVETLDFARPLDMFIILGFLFLIGVNFYSYMLIRKMQKKLEMTIRRIALKK